MTWREAFLAQARSDYRVMELLANSAVEPCHRLHYLQMATEKLARGWRASPTDRDPPPKTHMAFTRMLQQLKGKPWVRRQLGYQHHDVFRQVIDSLLETARRIEALVPSAAGYYQPNPEYPWQDQGTNVICIPGEFDYPDFNPKDSRLVKLAKLLRGLLRIAE